MTIKERLPSSLEAAREFILSLTEKLKQLTLKEKDIFNIKLSLEEAMVNAVKHGNKFNDQLYVDVLVEADNGCLTIKIKDQGEGFDFEHTPDPTASHNLRKPSGRGIFLIRNLMDGVSFFDCGRGIKMIKFLNKEAASEDPGRKN